MRRILVAALAGILLVPASAGAAGPRSCTPGFSWVEQAPSVRIFEVEIFDAEVDFKVPYLYACSARVRRPRLVTPLSPGTTTEVEVLATVGNRVLIEVYSYADGGSGSEVGWWDTRTGRRAFRVLNNLKNSDWGQFVVSGTVAKDGSVAYVRSTYSEGDYEDEGLPPEQYALFYLRRANGRFEKEKRITTLPKAELDPKTIAFDGDRITWRTQGAERSLEIPPDVSGRAPALAPPRRAYPGSCKSEPGEGVYSDYLTDSLPVRFFRIARGKQKGIWACRQGTREKGRRMLPATRSIDFVATTSRVAAFVTAPRGGDDGMVGWFEPKAVPEQLVRTAALRRDPDRVRDVVALAPDHARGLVVLNENPDGTYRVTFLRAFASGFDPETELASLQAAEVAPHTLAAKNGLIKWRTQGELRGAPLS